MILPLSLLHSIPAYFIVNVNCPCVLWVSLATTFQITRYVPGGKGGTLTIRSFGSEGSTLTSLLSTILPSILCTISVEKTGSRSLSNQILTTAGGVVTVEPTLGSEWSGKAWPEDVPGNTQSKKAMKKAATGVLI